MRAELLALWSCLQGFPSTGCQHTWLCPGMSPLGPHHPDIGRMKDPEALALGEEAACSDLYFICLLVFSSLLAHCQGLSAGKWVLCVPCGAQLIGTTSPFFQQGVHGQTIKEQSSELGICTLYRHAESHSCLQVPPVSISISSQEMLGEEVTAVRPRPIAFWGLLRNLLLPGWMVWGFFSYEMQLFYGNSCNSCSWQWRHVGKCPGEMPAPQTEEILAACSILVPTPWGLTPQKPCLLRLSPLQ